MHIFIHELGHSLGAKHDDEAEECVNMTDEDFLMTGDAKVILLNSLYDRLVTTTWKFKDFSVTQILCEINFYEFRSFKKAIFAIICVFLFS